jgi:hypothetical protein
MGSFRVSRSAFVAADPGLVHRLVNDLREWRAWSPWESLDPETQRSYTGPAAGVGAGYAWSGDRRTGQGTMEITGSTPERVDVALSLLKPFRSVSEMSFLLAPADAGTEVTWVMSGQQEGLAALVGRVVTMDRLIGRDFEKGLARLKAAAEA